MNYDYISTPIGSLLLVGNEAGLCRVEFERNGEPVQPEDGWTKKPKVLKEAKKQLQQYFRGKRKDFDLELHPLGTDFQCEVWTALTEIPYGETLSYGELAVGIGRPKAVRAVGAANGRNPLPIVVPCHRVIGSDGSLTGFGGGLDAKKFLLDLEGAEYALDRQMALGAG